MRSRRLVAWIVALTAVAMGLPACQGHSGSSPSGSGAASNGTANPNGTVSIAIGEPQHLLPTNSIDSNAYQALVGLFYPLVTFDKNSIPVMAQAQSVQTKDHKVWTIMLKPGFTFTDGTPVTAQDYINAWNYAAYGPNHQQTNRYFTLIDGYDDLNPGSGTPEARTLRGLTAPNVSTLRVTLSAPYIDFMSMIGFSAFLPLPKAAFDANGQIKPGFEDHLIGDGPFKLTPAGWQHNKEIVMVRNDSFPGPKPRVAAIDLKSYVSLTTAYADVRAGKLDILPQLPPADLAIVKADFGDRYRRSPGSLFEFLAFPTYDKAFSNANVRKAISMAIDRNKQILTIFHNSQQAAHSFVSPVLPGYRSNVCGDACAYHPRAARALYTANHGPEQIRITYNVDGGHKEWIDATCDELRKNLGVRCLAKPVATINDLLARVERRAPGVGMFPLGWVMDYPSMDNYLTPLYSTRGSSNYYGYHNARFDSLVRDGTRQPTQAAELAKYQQAEDIVAKGMPVIPMRFGENNYVFSTYVSDVFIDLFSAVDLYIVSTTRE